jgi:hypothetical protein
LLRAHDDHALLSQLDESRLDISREARWGADDNLVNFLTPRQSYEVICSAPIV